MDVVLAWGRTLGTSNAGTAERSTAICGATMRGVLVGSKCLYLFAAAPPLGGGSTPISQLGIPPAGNPKCACRLVSVDITLSLSPPNPARVV